MKKNILLFLLSILFFSKVFSQVVDPFSIRYQNQQKGGITMLSNVSVSCSNCTSTTSEVPPAGTGTNNAFTMSFVDIDGNPSTFMSSSDSLNLSNCSEVLWAGLYWTARVGTGGNPTATTNYNNRNKIKLKVNNGAYLSLVADELLDNSTGHQTYHCYKNITSIVQSNGIKARYTVADLVTLTQTSSVYGGWTIVVVYKNVFESMRNLTVFDGLANVSTGNSVTIPISGFVTPIVGPVNFELGVVSHDGDRSEVGDQLLFNGAGTYVNVSDASHNSNDVFNSSIAVNGILTPFRNPSFKNTLGHDVSIFKPNNASLNYIGNSSSSANIRITTGGETILTSVVTSVIDVFEPDLRATVSISDINGGQVNPGDVLEYTVVGKNIGSDISLGTFITDTLDPRTVYVPNSLKISFGQNSGSKTDAYGDDQGEYDPINKVIIARIGTGANAASGGSVLNSPTGADSSVVKFRVKVVNDCLMFQCDNTLEHKAYIFGTGNISGNSYNNNGLSDLYDASGCPSIASNALTINISGCPITAINYNSQICNSSNLQLTAPLSTSAIYNWTGPNGFTSSIYNPTISNTTIANQGTYNVEITFIGLDCMIDTFATVTVNSPPSIQLNSITNVNCFNGNTGAISISATGNGPFTYSWSNGNTTANPTGLAAGSYTVTVTNSLNCSTTQTFTVTQNTNITGTFSATSSFNGFNVSCFGGTNGSASVAVSGGTPGYTYLWSNGSTTNIASNLPAGATSVTITDNLGCTKLISGTLTQPTALQLSISGTNIPCFGTSSGSATTLTTGGVAPYSYSWASGTSSITNLAAGTYPLTVNDLNNCSTQGSVTILGPSAPLTLTSSQIEILCFGTNTGSIDISPIGGTLPYTYNWSNGVSTQDLSNISAGNYTVTVSDANNCQTVGSFSLTQPSSAISASSNITSVLCFGGNTGAIDISPNGGTGNYTYLWSTGATTQDLNNLIAGVYSVTITDQNNCAFVVSNLNLTQPAAMLGSTLLTIAAKCFGENTGSITQTTVGGTSPYSYLWNTGQTSQDLIAIPAGAYNVTVVDANGCTFNASANVSQPSTPIQLSENHVDILCFGETTGSIDITTVGGTSPYTFSWSSGQTTEDLSAIGGGIYSITVADQLGCTETIDVNVLQPNQALTLTETHTDALCIGAQQGTVNLNVTGGTAPYSYLWNNNSNNEDQSNLLAGIYSVLVTDNNNCQSTLNVEILDPSNTTVLSETHLNVACYNASTGSIDLLVTGGLAPHTFDWTNGAVSEDIANLPAGNYAVNVVDFNGCGEFISIQISEPNTAVTATIAHLDVLCNGYSTGSMTVSATGGVAPYTYNWDNGETTAQISNLTAGNYTVTVTDDNGCNFNLTQTLNQPPNPIIITETISDVNCFGNNTGNIQVTVAGGSPGYNYSWSTGSINSSISNLIAGTYNLTVTDLNNCTAQESYIVQQPIAPLSASEVNTPVSCHGASTGSVSVNVSGGTLPYSYLWSSGSTSNQIVNQLAGNYSLTITDHNGCTLLANYLITQPLNPLSLNLSMNPVICFGESNGNISASVAGGTTPYSYAWTSGSSTSNAQNLSAGNYSVLVTDFNNCQISGSTTVTQPSALSIQLSAVDVLCYGQATGSATVDAIGGQGIYSYSWSNGGLTPTISNLLAGNYTITVEDENGCSYNSSINVNQPQAPISFDFTTIDNLCFGGTNGSATVAISGGTSPYTYGWVNLTNNLSISNLSSGIYSFQSTDANGCALVESIEIMEPAQISIVDSLRTNVSCFDYTDGSISFTTIGGTPTYNYTWNTGETTEDIANLANGIYTVNISDLNNCQRSFSFEIFEPAPLLATSTIDEPSCFGYADGSIFTTVNGGTMPYSYAWNNSSTSQNNTNIVSGNYSVTITDHNNCVFILNTVLTQPGQIQVLFDANILIGCDPLEVILTNVSPEQFLSTWSFGDGTTGTGSQIEHSFSGAGCYDINLQITDANGCSNDVTYTDFICVLETPVAEIGIPSTELGVAYSETTITNLSTNADSYSWNLGGNYDYTYFEPGDYVFPSYQSDYYLITLIAYNDNGCIDTAIVKINFDNSLVMYVPNVFTPDGDEFNQVFKPIFPMEVASYHLKIYDRWGEMIFESTDTDIGWNGTYNDFLVQDGVYTWDIWVTTYDVHIYKKQGFVTVLK